MPELGESVTEGTVTRWLKQVGDTVEVDEPLLEVSTDKVDTEIPSPVAGTLLSITVDEDETVQVGAELAVVGDPRPAGQDRAAPSSSRRRRRRRRTPAAGATPRRPTQEPWPRAAPRPASGAPRRRRAERQRADGHRAGPRCGRRRRERRRRGGDGAARAPYVTPLVRKLAAENDVDLSTVSGFGRRWPDPQAGRPGRRREGRSPHEGAGEGAGGSRRARRPPPRRPRSAGRAHAGQGRPRAGQHGQDAAAAAGDRAADDRVAAGVGAADHRRRRSTSPGSPGCARGRRRSSSGARASS